MRFKAVLAPQQVSLLYNLVVPMSRLTAGSGESSSLSYGTASSLIVRNGCMMHLDNDSVRLSIRGKSNDADGVDCFAELKAGGGIFLEHRIQSKEKDNAIMLELDIVQLRMALQSIQQEKGYQQSPDGFHPQFQTVLKLAKRNETPCLCLESLTPGFGGGGDVEVYHSFPVRIRRASEIKQHLPPALPLPDVHLEIPLDKPLRTIMERLKAMAPTVYLKATKRGELTITCNSGGSAIETFLSNLTPRLENCKPESSACTVKVDSKKLTMCLQWQQPNSQIAAAGLCFVENEALILHVSLYPASLGFFTYYIPVHFLTHDPRDDD